MTLSWDVLIAEAVRQGWRAERRTRHVMLWAPSGTGFLTVSGTPGDQRAIHSFLAQARRLGLRWQGPRTPRRVAAPVLQVVAEPATPRNAELPVGEAVYGAVVAAGGALSTAEIATRTGRSRSEVKLALGDLVAAGYVVRVGSAPRGKPGVAPDGVFALSRPSAVVCA
jgi:hypothetical protein